MQFLSNRRAGNVQSQSTLDATASFGRSKFCLKCFTVLRAFRS